MSSDPPNNEPLMCLSLNPSLAFFFFLSSYLFCLTLCLPPFRLAAVGISVFALCYTVTHIFHTIYILVKGKMHFPDPFMQRLLPPALIETLANSPMCLKITYLAFFYYYYYSDCPFLTLKWPLPTICSLN